MEVANLIYDFMEIPFGDYERKNIESLTITDPKKARTE